jgi:hypothetical protein
LHICEKISVSDPDSSNPDPDPGLAESGSHPDPDKVLLEKNSEKIQVKNLLINSSFLNLKKGIEAPRAYSLHFVNF